MKEEVFGPEFLRRKYWPCREFREAVERRKKRDKQPPPETRGEEKPRQLKGIENYLAQIERIASRPRGLDLLAKILENRVVIKKENVREEDLREYRLRAFAERMGYNPEDLKDPETRRIIEGLFEKEPINREAMVFQIIEIQRRSLRVWLEYFTVGEGKNYPPAFRYWVVAEALKLGNYNRATHSFYPRSDHTLAPFPLLNPQAITIVFEEVKRKLRKEPPFLMLDGDQRKLLQSALQGESFGKLYGLALAYLESVRCPEEWLPVITGEWKTFRQSSDPQLLVDCLRDFNTGWCIANRAFAEKYLRNANLEIYFSQDREGKPTIPRVVIVYSPDGSEILEVRGIMDEQNLDPYILPVVEEKLRASPAGERWVKKLEQAKRLAEIYRKCLYREELSEEDLRFIYEIDEKIETFGIGKKDPRLEKMMVGRNVREDLARIFHCSPNQISLTREEVRGGGENILYHYGNLSVWPKLSQPLPRYVLGNLDLQALRMITPEGKLPEVVRGSVFASYAFIGTVVDEFVLPRIVDGDVFLCHLERVKRLTLPERVGGSIYLDDIYFWEVEKIIFPKQCDGIIFIGRIKSSDLKKIQEQHPHLRFIGVRPAYF